MLKKWIKQYLPKRSEIKKEGSLKIFGKMLHHPNLWHLNRYSAATATSIGLFCAFIPLPLQMLIAAALAIFFKANLPIAVVFTWITNPLTAGPISYACYFVGTKLLNVPPQKFHFEPTLEWVISQIDRVALPFLVGSFFVAIVLAILGNILIRIGWRVTSIMAWRARQAKTPKKAG